MDFVTGLLHNFRGFDAIWVIVDRMTNLAHFLPVKTTSTLHVMPSFMWMRLSDFIGFKCRLFLIVGLNLRHIFGRPSKGP